MRGVARVTLAVTAIMTVILARPAMAGRAEPRPVTQVGQDPCDLYPCQEGQVYAVHSLPDSVSHYACNSDGQAPSGAVDETADLQAWIDSVPDGGVEQNSPAGAVAERHILLFPADRCIRLDGHLRVSDRHYLIFIGAGVTLDQHRKPASGRRHPGGEVTWNGSGGWHVIRGSHLEWRSFKIVGNHLHARMQSEWGGGDHVRETTVTTYGLCHEQVSNHPSCEWQAAWLIMGSEHVTLEGNESRDTHGDGVEIFWDPNRTLNSREITINNHRIYRAGRQGISTMAVEGLTISNTHIEGAAQNAIDLEPEVSGFPIRRVAITRSTFGESYATTLVANGSCVEVSDISYTHNEQLEPNITGFAAVEMRRPDSCAVQRGPVTITDNTFRIEEVWVENDLAANISGYNNVTFSTNSVIHSCHDAIPSDACTADAPVSLGGGTGHVINDNQLALGGAAHRWRWVYRYNGISHGSLGADVRSCGTTTSLGPSQPISCIASPGEGVRP